MHSEKHMNSSTHQHLIDVRINTALLYCEIQSSLTSVQEPEIGKI